MVGLVIKGYYIWSYYRELNYVKKCNILMVYVFVYWYRGSNFYLGEN